MRSYENLGSNPYNDNYRSESRGSARNYYSGEYDPTNRVRSSYGSESSGRNESSRMGGFGSGRDTHASSGYGGTSSYGRSAGISNYGSGSSNYGSGSYGSGSSRRYGSSDWDTSDRYGDRDAWDRGSDEVKSWFGDDEAERRRRRDERRDDLRDRAESYRSNRGYSGTTGYGSSSNYGSSYGTGHGSGSSYGTSGYSSNRYSSDWDRNRDRDRDEDRGFFDRAGDEVRSWFGDEEAERRRRMDEMRDREHDTDYSSRYKSHTSYGNTYSGPPYSYGSSSRRDYEW
jgi:hypothetical protein